MIFTPGIGPLPAPAPAVSVVIETSAPITFYYASPYTIYSAGAAGFEPQKRPGRGAMLAIVGAAVLLPLLLAGIGLLLTR
ncbi:hypothetical protein [Nocardia brasiliensis]|uniref:hypothetical protein n=1 Tax=Nocardia brasiliensis TaxID=37326 RepID=UPI002457B82E|nr:hypothetical protein [Nocardia brasiliensis]